VGDRDPQRHDQAREREAVERGRAVTAGTAVASRPPGKARSFDDLVGAGQQRGWHFEAKRLGGLEIDDQLKLRRYLHRQVGRLLTLEDDFQLPPGCWIVVLFSFVYLAGGSTLRRCPYISSSTYDTQLNSNNCMFFSIRRYSGMLIFQGRV